MRSPARNNFPVISERWEEPLFEHEDEHEHEHEDDWAGSCRRSGKSCNHRTSLNLVSFEPALVHQKSIGNRVGKAWHGRLVVGLHRPDLDNFAIGLNKRDRERDRGIFHPEGNPLGRRKDKKHPGIFSECLPET